MPDRMCVRRVCELVGEPTEAGTCPACGYKTREFDEEESTRLRRVHGQAAGPPKSPVLIVTTNEVVGHRIEEVLGDVFGLIVRSRNYFSNLGASVRTVVGGEVEGYTRLLTDSRNDARERMRDEARRLGANAVVAMRFDCNAIGDAMNEVAAYGTAVRIVPDQAPAVAATATAASSASSSTAA